MGYLGIAIVLVVVIAVCFADYESRCCRYCDRQAIDGHAEGCPASVKPAQREKAINLFEAGRRHAQAGIDQMHPDETTYLLGYRRGAFAAPNRQRQTMM